MDDPRQVLADARERTLEREGIPMFLAFQSADPVPAAEEPVRAEGGALAELLTHYRAELAPDAADDSEEALIDVLQVMAVAHFTGARDEHEEQR
ncbi:hypothetical protein ACGFZL_12920 [Streptomyces sp. NPDC048182]|uniref:hypothetical protein n=1 Tax=Streptomyces sp. NPDC048182 TaxID=3365507 RepID=UPI00371F9744